MSTDDEDAAGMAEPPRPPTGTRARSALPPRGAAPLDAVPTAFAVTVERRDRAEVGRHTFESLKNEKVVVRANGFIYRGVLIGADEGELYLRGEMRWWVLPLAHVTDVAKDDAKDGPIGGPERWEPKTPDAAEAPVAPAPVGEDEDA